MSEVFSKENLLIIGAGQYGQVAREIAESMNCFDKISFLDDNNPKAVGKMADYEKFVMDYEYAIVAIGNSALRLEFTEKLRIAGYQIAKLISPMAYISPSSVIREGCIVEAMTVVNTEAELNECCFISAGAVVNHNSVLKKGCHINCHATVSSNAVVEAGQKIDYNQLV